MTNESALPAGVVGGTGKQDGAAVADIGGRGGMNDQFGSPLDVAVDIQYVGRHGIGVNVNMHKSVVGRIIFNFMVSNMAVGNIKSRIFQIEGSNGIGFAVGCAVRI